MALTEGMHTAEFLLSEGNGYISREAIVIAAESGKLEAGTVLGRITTANSASAAAKAGNTGTATFGTMSADNTANTGVYVLKVTKAAAGVDPVEFTVTAPGGKKANGTSGVAFTSLGLGFTFTDGTDTGVSALGAEWNITVQAGAGQYVAYASDGTNDGRRVAVGVLYAGVDASGHEDVPAVAIARQAEVMEAALIGLDATAKTGLATLDIIVR